MYILHSKSKNVVFHVVYYLQVLVKFALLIAAIVASTSADLKQTQRENCHHNDYTDDTRQYFDPQKDNCKEPYHKSESFITSK